MSRKTRNLLISAVALAVLAGAFLIVRNTDGKTDVEDTTPEVKTVVLTETPSSDLRSVMVENADGGYHLYSSDGAEWLVADTPKYYRTVQAGLLSAVRSFAGARGQEIETDADAARLAEFGFDDPTAVVTLRDKDGIATVLEFGSRSPTGAGHFARNPDSGAVALVPAFTSMAALATSEDFRNMSLPTVDPAALAALSFRSGDTVVVAEPARNSDPFVATRNPLDLVSPFRGRYGLDSYELNKILTEEAPLPVAAREWLDDADPGDPALGLDEETADRISMMDTEGGALILRVGAEDGEGNRYAMLGDRDEAVFLLGEEDLAFLNIRAFDLLDKFMFLANIIDVGAVKVEHGPDTWIMEREEFGEEGNSKDDKFTINGLPMDHEDYSSVYQKFIGLMWEGVISERKTLEYPEVRITVRHDMPGVDNRIIRFWDYDDVYYQATVGDNPLEFLVSRYQVGLFLEELAVLAEFGS